jgi:hypothetical protein
MLSSHHRAPTGHSPHNGLITILVQPRELQILAWLNSNPSKPL